MASDLRSGLLGGVENVRANPWLVLLGAFGLILAGLGLSVLTWEWVIPVRVFLLIAGVLVVGGVLWLRLSSAWIHPVQGNTASLFLLVAAGAPLLAACGLDDEWDTAKLVLHVLTAVALVAAFLVYLPQVWRRVAISFFVMYHFAGIFVATTAPPTADPSPWWNVWIWSHLYHNYYTFMYLTNAYHFYSPNPGPPSYLWYRVQYEDNSYRWVKIPELERFHTRLEFTRRLGLTEATAAPSPIWETELQIRVKRRAEVGRIWGIPYFDNAGPPSLQFQKPTPASQRMVASSAHHVALHYPSKENPALTVESVKVYRLTQRMLSQQDFAEGKDPLDPERFFNIFLGEFDAGGNLRPDDGFRYWCLPFMWIPFDEWNANRAAYPVMDQTKPKTRTVLIDNKEVKEVLADYVRKHGGDTPQP